MLWQASSSGRYNHHSDAYDQTFTDPRGKSIERRLDPNFQYWGHAVTDATGTYNIRTILPGYYPADLKSGWFRPPHIHFIAQAQGLPELVTQTYFRGDAIADNEFIQSLNARDYILRDHALTKEEQDRLVIEYKPATKEPDILAGTFDFQMRTK
jgi:protocatechuate 3,4-dioxygenase beta subunit